MDTISANIPRSLVLFEGYIVLYDIFNGLPIEHLDGLQFFTIITDAPDAPVNFFTETSLHSSLSFRTNRWVKGYLHFKGFRYICPKGLTKQYNQLLWPPAESWSSFKSSGTYLKEREVGSYGQKLQANFWCGVKGGLVLHSYASRPPQFLGPSWQKCLPG